MVGKYPNITASMRLNKVTWNNGGNNRLTLLVSAENVLCQGSERPLVRATATQKQIRWLLNYILLEPAPPASRDSNCSARALYFLKYENTQIKFLSGKLSVAWWPTVCRDTCARSAPYCCRPFSPDVDLYADSRTPGYRSHFRDYPGHDGWSWRWSPSSAHATCLFESGAWGSVLSTSFWGEIWPENKSRWEVVSHVLIGEKLLK